MAQVIIGVDPHKRSATIEIINSQEKALGQGRFGTDRDGYKARSGCRGVGGGWIRDR
jgi:hypothetical protein